MDKSGHGPYQVAYTLDLIVFSRHHQISELNGKRIGSISDFRNSDHLVHGELLGRYDYYIVRHYRQWPGRVNWEHVFHVNDDEKDSDDAKKLGSCDNIEQNDVKLKLLSPNAKVFPYYSRRRIIRPILFPGQQQDTEIPKIISTFNIIMLVSLKRHAVVFLVLDWLRLMSVDGALKWRPYLSSGSEDIVIFLNTDKTSYSKARDFVTIVNSHPLVSRTESYFAGRFLHDHNNFPTSSAKVSYRVQLHSNKHEEFFSECATKIKELEANFPSEEKGKITVYKTTGVLDAMIFAHDLHPKCQEKLRELILGIAHVKRMNTDINHVM